MSNQAGVEWPAGGRAAERACVAHRAQVLDLFAEEKLA
jgi:hypothetical protein